MCVVGVGLVKVYKALIRLASGAFSIPLLISISETFSVLFHCNKTKALSNQALSPIPKLNLLLEITNLTQFAVSCQGEASSVKTFWK